LCCLECRPILSVKIQREQDEAAFRSLTIAGGKITLVKRISTEAYEALGEALAVITWNKRPFQSLLRTALRDHPELLAGLNFDDTKRAVADQLVVRLVDNEHRYRDTTLILMLEVGGMEEFPNIQQMAEKADRELRLADARRAVARLRSLTEA
jgi:hypothetical protein